MLTRSYLAAACLALAATTACSRPPEPITVSDNIITIENQSSRDWRNVIITVNDHYRGGAPELAARGRLNAPLSQFQTGFGQRFPTDRSMVLKVEVTATDAKGQPIRLQWGSRK